MNIPINHAAPVVSSGEIEIDAPLDKVWRILTTINDWPNWQEGVTSAELNGNLEEGAVFKWKAGGLSFTSKIHTAQPNRVFGWTGKTIGASAVHNWIFNEGSGKTVVRVEESLQGLFPRIFKGSFQRSLDKSVLTNLEELKNAAEQ